MQPLKRVESKFMKMSEQFQSHAWESGTRHMYVWIYLSIRL